MPASTHRLSIVLLAITTALAACGDDADDSSADGTTTTVGQTVEGDDTAPPTTLEGTTTTTTPDESDCGSEDWVTVDVGPFSFRTPPDLIDQNVEGIDSLVGQYQREGMTAGFDFGWYSGNVTTQYPDDATTVTVDGLEGDFVQVDTGDEPLADSAFLTFLYVPIPGDGDDISQTALAFWVRYADEADGAAAACITETIDFS